MQKKDGNKLIRVKKQKPNCRNANVFLKKLGKPGLHICTETTPAISLADGVV